MKKIVPNGGDNRSNGLLCNLALRTNRKGDCYGRYNRESFY
jgi:hypothetical protein